MDVTAISLVGEGIQLFIQKFFNLKYFPTDWSSALGLFLLIRLKCTVSSLGASSCFGFFEVLVLEQSRNVFLDLNLNSSDWPWLLPLRSGSNTDKISLFFHQTQSRTYSTVLWSDQMNEVFEITETTSLILIHPQSNMCLTSQDKYGAEEQSQLLIWDISLPLRSHCVKSLTQAELTHLLNFSKL